MSLPSSKVTFGGAFPIGDTDPLRLPVKHFGPTVGYYVHVLGFAVAERTDDQVTLTRDNARIGLVKSGDDPEQASVYFAVSDVDALYEELAATGIEPSEPDSGEHGGDSYRIFFARDPYGVCFCFGKKVERESTPPQYGG